MNVYKRDGREVLFDESKITNAINRANKEVGEKERATVSQIKIILSTVEAVYKAEELSGKKGISVEDIQDIIEKVLVEKFGKYELAKKYILYRYQRELVRKSNTTDESILSLIRNDNRFVMEENSNKNAYINSTQRDLIAGEVSKDLSKRLLLPKDILQAHEDGILHFHDMDYFIQPMFNCCLINIKDMLDNGTVMNGKLIETPHSFQVACTITTQIIAAVASGQYGGQSVNIKHLGKYLKKSHDKYRKIVRKEFMDNSLDSTFETEEKYNECVERIAKQRMLEELKNGVQTIQYQINTLMTTNGQSPFVTLFLHIDDEDEYEEYSALIIEEIIKQRYEGIKNEKGVFITPAFPKLIYVLDENNMPGGKYNHITKLAAKCTAKRLYPDYISAKKMRENYEGNVFSCMGCVHEDERVIYKINGSIRSTTIGKMWEEMASKFEVRLQDEFHKDFLYINTPGVEIFDSLKGFVKNYRIIKNVSGNWRRVHFSNGKEILCTADHPFEILIKGVVFASDLKIGDELIFANRKHGFTENPTDDDHETVSVTKVSITKIEGVYPSEKIDSYDVTTESEHFEVSGMYSHNCRSFLSPWKDRDGNYKWEGRFNMGVVSINLPQIGLYANGDENEFWKLLDERLELCKKALMCRYKNLLNVTSDVSPIHWQYGAIARLKPGEKINELLENGYATISLGYIGLYETTVAMKGVSHTTEEGKEFALRVIKRLKEATDTWKKETGLAFGLYGTPAESLCYRFAEIDKNKFGEIENITDKGYYTNSYHVDVREKIDIFSKFDFESEFQNISSGGAISYAEIPNMEKNLEAVEKLVYYIYDHIQYGEFNTKSDFCHECGFTGEIILNDENQWECPNCGNKDKRKMNVTRRTCGYLGENFWNVGKTKEIKSRITHI